MTKPRRPSRKAVVGHYRHLIATLTAMSTQNPDDIRTVVAMVHEHDEKWLYGHIGFLYQQLYEQLDITVHENKETWLEFLTNYAKTVETAWGDVA